MSDHRLTFVALSVSDLQDPWYGGEHAACSWTDGAFLHFALYPALAPHRPVTRSAQVGFHVDQFDEVYARIQGAGTIILQPPRSEPWGDTARFLDPDGNIVSVTRR